MAFFESNFKYHRYNFYEIKKMSENGEDVRTFVPRNPAEASMISSAIGGSSASGVPIHIYNNPNVKGLYYSLITSNGFTKFVFDFKKYAEFLETYGLIRNISLDDNVPSGSNTNEIRLFGYRDSWYTVLKISGTELRIDFNDGKYGVTLNYNQLGVGAESLTYRTLFNTIGKVDVSLINDSGEEYSDILTIIFTPRLDNNASEGNNNLNEYPIDYMWFE